MGLRPNFGPKSGPKKTHWHYISCSNTQNTLSKQSNAFFGVSCDMKIAGIAEKVHSLHQLNTSSMQCTVFLHIYTFKMYMDHHLQCTTKCRSNVYHFPVITFHKIFFLEGGGSRKQGYTFLGPNWKISVKIKD